MSYELKTPSYETMTRRRAVGRLAALLAAGCWPGFQPLRASDATGGFCFMVANDFHHNNSECDPWFDALFRQASTHARLAFCIGLGDLADHGRVESIAAIQRSARLAQVPFYAVPGNHDKESEGTTRIYAEIFPKQINYTWTHAGWQFVAIDSTQGKDWLNTRVSNETLAWLDKTLPTLDRKRPLVLCTHFPLSHAVYMCPVNSEDVLARFVGFNLREAFSGHFHGQTVQSYNGVELVTNACCSRVAKNFDGTSRKGYWLCEAGDEGNVTREFVEFSGRREALVR